MDNNGKTKMGAPVRPPVKKEIENVIAKLRRRTGWSQEKLGEKLGKYKSAISEYERGVRDIPKTVALLAQSILDELPPEDRDGD